MMGAASIVRWVRPVVTLVFPDLMNAINHLDVRVIINYNLLTKINVWKILIKVLV